MRVFIVSLVYPIYIEKENEFKRHLKENKLRGCVVVLQEPAKMY